mgnify:CR=1 FL=1|jgi:hypothetical protein
MKKHIQIYMKHFDYVLDDFIGCEVCGAKAVDIHHIEPKGMGGSKTKDFIANLMALCRSCHTKCHTHKAFSSRAKEIHMLKMELHEKKLRGFVKRL